MVELELLLLEPEAGVEALFSFSIVVLLLLLEPEAGLPFGFTTVVLFSVLWSAAAGVAVSVFCSQAPRRAALARMQIYFFIGFVVEAQQWAKA